MIEGYEYDKKLFKQANKEMEIAKNHFNNATKVGAIDVAIAEMRVAEAKMDLILKNMRGKNDEK